jgi:hypothetical protein
MRPGNLALISVAMPILFESMYHNPTKVVKSGDVVVLLKYIPKAWGNRPYWKVLCGDQVGHIEARFIEPLGSAPEEYLDEEDD